MFMASETVSTQIVMPVGKLKKYSPHKHDEHPQQHLHVGDLKTCNNVAKMKGVYGGGDKMRKKLYAGTHTCNNFLDKMLFSAVFSIMSWVLLPSAEKRRIATSAS